MQTPTSVSTHSTTTKSERRRDGPIIHPERPGKPVCGIYQYDGTCDFGAACPFDHPTDLQPTGPKKRKRGEKKPRLTLRGFTPEENQAHFKRVKETDGFHVGYVLLGSRRGGMIYPVPLSQCSSIPKNLAKLAIKGHNIQVCQAHSSKYEVRWRYCVLYNLSGQGYEAWFTTPELPDSGVPIYRTTRRDGGSFMQA